MCLKVSPVRNYRTTGKNEGVSNGMSRNNRDLASGRNYVWRLLKFRQRSESEIRDKLKARKYDAQIIAGLVTYFKDSGDINDREFARAWIDERCLRPMGLKQIRLELKQKGVDEEIIKELLSEKKRTLNEAEIVQELVSKRFDKLKEKKGHLQRTKARIYGYLVRRGFSGGVVYEAVEKTVA